MTDKSSVQDMSDAIFLSTEVPDPRQEPEYAASADTVAINSAIRALVYVSLGRRPLVFADHPAITDMIGEIAEDLDVNHDQWITTYNLQVSDSGTSKDIADIRRKMLSEHRFNHAIFIGGGRNTLEEFDLLQKIQPGTGMIPVVSTGGVARTIPDLLDHSLPDDLASELAINLDYTALFHNNLGISVLEERFRTPEMQSRNSGGHDM